MTFSCIHCKLQFQETEEQKIHFKSDHHRYNLKRKVLGLEPISLTEFQQKQVGEAPKPAENVVEKNQKHQKKWQQKQEKMAFLESLEDDKNWEKLQRKTPQDCLFCKKKFPEMEKMKKHLFSHGFFCPDSVDAPALLQYLQDKISITNCCIYCNKQFYSVEQTIHHMVDKQHCKLTDEDYNEYYIGLEEEEEEESIEEGEEGEWEDVSEHSDEELVAYITPDESRLVLPNGNELGSRQYSRYWKQNLRPTTTRPQINTGKGGNSLALTVKERQQLIVKQQEMKQLQKQSKRELQRENDFRSRVGMKQNYLQHHYREQNPF